MSRVFTLQWYAVLLWPVQDWELTAAREVEMEDGASIFKMQIGPLFLSWKWMAK